jgi:glycosyltransferase involved in cell wall biosynthesis
MAVSPIARSSALATRRVVAVDARTLTQTGKGVPRFLAETLRELARYPELKLILFSNRPLHPSHDLPIETVIDRAWRKMPGSLWMMARLNALALRAGADTIWGPAHVLPPRHCGLRSILTVHDLVHRIMPQSMGRWNRRISTWLVEPSIHRADRIVAVSETTRDDVLALVRPARRDIKVVYMGARVSAPDNAADARGNYLFTLGSIELRKNIDGLLRCFTRLRARCPELELRLTGAHSWGASDTLALIKHDDACHLLGFLSEAELTAQMAGAKAFVMPSHYEGFGLPVIEAVGLAPIIAADIPVFRELGRFVDGICFVDFTDPDHAAEAIAFFLATDPPPAQFVAGVQNLFEWQATARRYADVFMENAMDVRI